MDVFSHEKGGGAKHLSLVKVKEGGMDDMRVAAASGQTAVVVGSAGHSAFVGLSLTGLCSDPDRIGFF